MSDFKPTEKDMRIARLQARVSVLTQAMASIARRSPEDQHWVQNWIKAADEAARNVEPDDLYDPSTINLN